MLDSLLERFRTGDRRALSRLLTLAAQGELEPETLARLPEPKQSSRVIAITGSAGVGKSTLTGKLLEFLRRKGKRVAVLACDPQSPVSGGALLGDRVRMPAKPDEGVFIRSLAAVSGHGAVAEHLAVMIRLLESFAFDIVMLETVGAGQGDVAVHDLADVVILLLQPHTGDDLQWEKAGILEVADLIVIHKSDLPSSEQVEAQVRSMVELSGHETIPILRVSGKTGEGLDALWNTVDGLPNRRNHGPKQDKELLQYAQLALARWFRSAKTEDRSGLPQLLKVWREGRLADDAAWVRLLELARQSQS